jgi:hypothetical protein
MKLPVPVVADEDEAGVGTEAGAEMEDGGTAGAGTPAAEERVPVGPGW